MSDERPSKSFFVELEASNALEAMKEGKENFDRVDFVKGCRLIEGGSKQHLKPDQYGHNSRLYAVFGRIYI